MLDVAGTGSLLIHHQIKRQGKAIWPLVPALPVNGWSSTSCTDLTSFLISPKIQNSIKLGLELTQWLSLHCHLRQNTAKIHNTLVKIFQSDRFILELRPWLQNPQPGNPTKPVKNFAWISISTTLISARKNNYVKPLYVQLLRCPSTLSQVLQKKRWK